MTQSYAHDRHDVVFSREHLRSAWRRSPGTYSALFRRFSGTVRHFFGTVRRHAPLAMRWARGDNRWHAQGGTTHVCGGSSGKSTTTFRRGTMAVVTLGNPREKFWGMVLTLSAEGLSLSGIELASFEDMTAMVKSGEPFTPAVVFFPMHRIERIELDCTDGGLPSLTQRFQSRTGMKPRLLASSLSAAAGNHAEEPGKERA